MHWIDQYMQQNPLVARRLIEQIERLNITSVTIRRDIKVVFMRAALEIAESGTTGRNADEIYTELCTLFCKELDQLGR